jgi:hypothetical protein
VLDEVRKRYGIRPSGQEGHPPLKTSSRAKKATEQEDLRHPLEQSTAKKPRAPIRRMHSTLDLGWVYPSGSDATGSVSDNQSFHYLIHIAECALTLHCEINAANEAAALHRVEQIPNLLGWRQILGEELAELIKKERALATQDIAGRLMGGAKHYVLAKKPAKGPNRDAQPSEPQSDPTENRGF